jgi:hypothetical protein
MNKWIVASAALVIGFGAAAVIARQVERALGRPGRPEALRSASGPLSTLVFWSVAGAGLIAALGAVNPDSLAALPQDLVRYLPRLLAAAILIIGGRVVATFGEIAVGRMVARSSPGVQRRVISAVRTTITVLAVLLAVSQLGVDTTIVTLAVAATFFGVAATLTLLVGLGGREVASELAAARAVRRLVGPGDALVLDGFEGEVVALHDTAVEVRDGAGVVRLVPASRLLRDDIVLRRAGGLIEGGVVEQGGPE